MGRMPEKDWTGEVMGIETMMVEALVGILLVYGGLSLYLDVVDLVRQRKKK